MPSTTPPLGVMSVGPCASGSSIPAMRPAKQVHAPLYAGPSPTRSRPNMPCGTCFSPARKVLLVPSLIIWMRVLDVQEVRRRAGGEVVLTDGVTVPTIRAPLLLTLNQFWALGSFGLPRM